MIFIHDRKGWVFSLQLQGEDDEEQRHPNEQHVEPTIHSGDLGCCSRTRDTIVPLARSPAARDSCCGQASVPKMVVDWSKLRWRDGERWDIDVSNVTVRHLLDLLDANKKLKAHKQQKKVDVKIAPHHFDKGRTRWVYQARKRVSGQTHVFRTVVKRLKKGTHSWELYVRHMELQAMGRIFAHAFNQAMRQCLSSTEKVIQLDFAKVETLRVNGHHYDLEAYQAGIFVKYNNNVASGPHEYMSRLLQTFSHWTYQTTWGKLMLTDFQGVHLRHDFLLSDLVVHYWTNDQRFYHSDKGKEGMYSFFRSHRCNSHCELLGLKPHRLQPNYCSD